MRERNETGDMLQKLSEKVIPDRKKKNQSIYHIRKAIEKKTISYTPSWGELFFIELQYVSPVFWMLQGFLMMALICFLEKTAMEKGVLTDYLRWASILAAWMGVAGCGSLGRHFVKGMAELEQSCYFNLSQMWAIKMTFIGSVDFLVLLFCSGRIAEKTSASFLQVCLYVLVPFVLSNVCCLLWLTALRGGRNRYGVLAVAIMFAALSALTPAEFYAQSFLWVWIAALLMGIGMYLWQLRHMYQKINRGEMICWN